MFLSLHKKYGILIYHYWCQAFCLFTMENIIMENIKAQETSNRPQQQHELCCLMCKFGVITGGENVLYYFFLKILHWQVAYLLRICLNAISWLTKFLFFGCENWRFLNRCSNGKL